MGFFVQLILAGRYIHRRELRLISFESYPCVEYGIKKISLKIKTTTLLFTILTYFTKIDKILTKNSGKCECK